MKLSNNQQAFLELVRAGLWERDASLLPYDNIDFKEVYQLAKEQTVTGLTAAGLEHVSDVKPPKEIVLSFVGDALQLEQHNIMLNYFVSVLVEKLRGADIYTLLVKGQGIAQCYERPLWRECGDIDFFLSESNYEKAKTFLTPLASSFHNEDMTRLHLSMKIESWEVELHGNLKTFLWRKLDKVIDDLQKVVFCEGAVRSWMNRNTQVFIPRVDEDVIFVFTHILQHFYRGGVGMRQICDWCRLLWKYGESINKQILKNRLCEMGVMSEWKTFSAFAVNYLGMPVESMPFYSSSSCWNRKANVLVGLILEMGNMGHSRDNGYQYNKPVSLRRTITLWRLSKDNARQLLITPINPIRVWSNMVFKKLFH